MNLQTVLDAIKAVKMETKEKAIGYVVVIKNLAGEEAAIDAEIKRLQGMIERRKRNKECLIAALKFGMETLGLTEVSNGVHKAKIVNNSQPSIEVVNEEAVPVEFKREVREVKVDRKAILQQIKETGEIPDGIEAHQGNHLRIS